MTPRAESTSAVTDAEREPSPRIPARAAGVLACPHCGGALRMGAAGASCRHCLQRYATTDSGSLDLRLRHAKRYTLTVDLGTHLPSAPHLAYTPLMRNAAPAVDYAHEPVPFHLSPELLSHFPRAQSADSLVLDLGCGGTVHRAACERAGFQYVGLDYDAPNAPILGDAHALPFASDSFEWVLAIAVLEHIRHPLVAVEEVFRVLKPGGVFIGTVAFLEPFHMNSYYHHSHLGTLNSLQHAGFDVRCVSPNAHWTGLRAQAFMSLFRRMPPRLIGAVIWPTHALHRVWRRAAPNSGAGRAVRDSTGSFTFIAARP